MLHYDPLRETATPAETSYNASQPPPKTRAGQSMATAGQIHARQLQIVEVVLITTSTSTVSSKPSPPLFSSGLSVSALESGDRPAAAAGIPPSAEPARRRRQWPRCRAVPHQQDRRACTERLHPPDAASLADEVLVCFTPPHRLRASPPTRCFLFEYDLYL
jgi:hypothetical protein